MRARTGWIMLALLAVTIAGVALAPPTTGVPEGGEEFRAYLLPRLVALEAASESVDAMVRERSRNVLALRTESERIAALTDDIDAYLAAHDTPAWAEGAVADYRAGRDRLSTAIDAAWDALRSFDFSAMPEMIPIFEEGTALIRSARASLEDSAGSASVVHWIMRA